MGWDKAKQDALVATVAEQAFNAGAGVGQWSKTGGVRACPARWCKSDQVVIHKFTTPRRALYTVLCQKCGTKSPQVASRSKIIRVWNGESPLITPKSAPTAPPDAQTDQGGE